MWFASESRSELGCLISSNPWLDTDPGQRKLYLVPNGCDRRICLRCHPDQLDFGSAPGTPEIWFWTDPGQRKLYSVPNGCDRRICIRCHPDQLDFGSAPGTPEIWFWTDPGQRKLYSVPNGCDRRICIRCHPDQLDCCSAPGTPEMWFWTRAFGPCVSCQYWFCAAPKFVGTALCQLLSFTLRRMISGGIQGVRGELFWKLAWGDLKFGVDVP